MEATKHIEPIKIMYRGEPVRECTLWVWAIGLVVCNSLPLRKNSNSTGPVKEYRFGFPFLYSFEKVKP